MNGNQEELRLLENIVTELQHLKEKQTNTNNKLDTIISNQTEELTKLDQIIANTTPQTSDDITSLGGSISTPKKINP